MVAKVFVTLKKSVLDPQGKAVHHAVEAMGFKGVEEVRVGKMIEVRLGDGISRKAAEAELKKMADRLLANPVIENWTLEILESAEVQQA